MSFSYSGGVITQTGTDTDLSGLIGLTGVTTTTSAPDGIGSQKTYTINVSTRIIVSGTLNHDPDYEQLIVESDPAGIGSAPMIINGTYNYGVARTGNSKTQYSIGTGLIFTNNGNNFFSRFAMVNNGVFNWKGGVIKSAGTLLFSDGSTVTVDAGTMVNSSDLDTYQLRLSPNNSTNSALLTINNITLAGTGGKAVRFFTTYGFEKAVFKLTNGQVQTWNGNYPEQTYLDFDNADNISSTDLNFSNGTATRAGNVLFKNVGKRVVGEVPVNRYGYVKQLRVVELNPVDLSGTDINTYSYHGTDFDSGNRVIGTNNGGTDGNGLIVDQDDTDTKVYTAIDVTGVYFDDILIEIVDANNTTLTVDDRTSSDTIPIKFISYNESITTWADTLTGIGTLSKDITMTPDLSISQATRAMVDVYTELETSEKFYDRAKSYLCSNFSTYQDLLVTRNGSSTDVGSYDIDIDATAISVFSFNGSKITIKASEFIGNITTTGTISLLNGAKVIGTITDSSGSSTKLQYSVTGLVNNSRVQIYNMSTMTEFYNSVNGTELNGTYTEGVDFSDGDTVRLRATNVQGLVCYKEYEATAIAGSNGFSFLVNQTLDPVYSSLAIDGSTVTKFTADYANDEIDIVIGSDFLLSELYAWWEYTEYSEEGIRAFFGGLTGVDEANFNIHNDIVDIKLDNTTSTNVAQLDNRRLYRDDLTRPVVNPTSGGGGIDVEWRSPVLLANSDKIEEDLTTVLTNTNRVDGLIEDDAGDQFTTKALSQASGGGSSDVNIVSVNGVATTGVDDFKATSVVASNMRGTDGANTIAPDNAGITANGVAIGALNNVSTAQVQSSCDTAVTANVTIGNIDTGVDSIEAKLPVGTISDFDETANQVIVSTNNDKTNYQLANNSITSSVVANNALNNSAFTNGYYNSINSEVDEALSDYDGPTRLEATADKDEIIASLPDVSGLSTFDSSSDEVITNSASREASKADISSLGTHADLEIINTGVKKASKLIPHNGDLP